MESGIEPCSEQKCSKSMSLQVDPRGRKLRVYPDTDKEILI